jgi:predicted DNA-binding protein
LRSNKIIGTELLKIKWGESENILHVIMDWHKLYGRRYAMKTAAAHNFHVPLPSGVYRRLRSEAERQHKPATQLVKQVVEYWLDEQEKLALHEEIARYAAEVAGSSDDLDEQMEAASLEYLQNSEKLT